MDYKDVIESRYNRQNWLLLLRDIFGNKAKFWSTPYVVDTNSQMAKQALWLGTISLSDEQTIAIYEVELTDKVDIERNRRGIRDMLLTQWRNNGNAGAFMFCYRENESVLRFSYVSESWKFDDDGSYQKESTDTRRFTYLLGEGHRSRTAIQQFETLKGSAQTLKDLTKAFSVDAVSDMFFKDYKEQYADIIFYITGKRMVKKGNKWEEVKEGNACRKILDEFSKFADPEKAVRDYVKKLMGRLVFLQFLQKKGWLGVPLNEDWGNGDHEFIQNLFANTKDKDNFVDGVLEVLFDDLNTERKDDISQLSIFNYQFKIPYLNGGLFERDATDETRFPLPAKYMEDMLEFFSRYNFTIDENDPNDAEVGVDPEMLGRIFENLLEDNKDKGAFYTPKEIVQYMCRESLIAYLQTDVKDESTKEAIRQFVTTHEVEHLGDNKKLAEQVDESLRNVKICDPAIGSGAFPMGLLKELYLCRSAIEGLDDDNASEIKKHIIQHNIYGVDIEKGAVDIARLRFWLSLIVDEKTLHALPNLDFKIMQGNSLLEQYQGVDLSTVTEKKKTDIADMFEDMVDVLRLELRNLLAKYYDCTDHKEKKALRKKITDNVKQQLLEQGITINFGDLDLAGNDQFFLWHTWFYDVFSQGGFDIVIGNPPYIRQEKLAHDYKRLLCSVYPNVGEGTADILVYFFGLGINVLRENGILTFITSNKFLKTQYGRSIRRTFTNYVDVMSFIDFFELPVFHNASTDAGITLLSNRLPISETKYFPVKTLDNLNLTELTSGEYLDVLKNEEEWKFVNKSDNSIIEKLESDTIRLGDFVQNRIYRGITTGLNKAFVLSNWTDSYHLLHSESKPIIKKYAKSKDIQRWYIKNDDKYFIASGFDIDLKKKYPTAYKYLCKFKKDLETRCDKGEHFYNLRACAYYDEFEREKIIYIHTAKNHQFFLDTEGRYINNSCYMIISNSKYLLCFLNSKLFHWYKRIKFVAYGDGNEGGRCKLDYNKMVTIPVKRNVDESVYQDIMDNSKEADADIASIEKKIDEQIFHLYNLTYDEVLIVDPDTPITREEYENYNAK